VEGETVLRILHRPVLLKASLRLLNVSDGVYVDGTVGSGGHSLGILNRLGRGFLIGLDQDPLALEIARPILETTGKEFYLHSKNFRHIKQVLKEHRVKRIQGIILDLGVSQMQLADPERGFSYRPGTPLDMRMNPSEGRSAAWYLRHLPEERLGWVFSEYGEISWARRLARAVVHLRESGRDFEDAADLLEAIRLAAPKSAYLRKNPRSQVFMALRILVNDELGALDEILDILPAIMAPAGRSAILSYHSLEDRRVKQAFLGWQKRGLGKVMKPFPVMLTREEAKSFPEGRSVRLRAFEWKSDE
jgi:16S rRNA (cytosine1402-N4)-methyltransferase